MLNNFLSSFNEYLITFHFGGHILHVLPLLVLMETL